MKLAIPAIPVIALGAVLAVGCATKKDPPPANAALDVSPTGNTALTATPSYTPPPAPTYTPPTPAYTPTTPSPSAETARTAGGQTYTVQKGDTLFKIAREHYGDAKQWTRIAAANPGLNANAIKVGQKINLP